MTGLDRLTLMIRGFRSLNRVDSQVQEYCFPNAYDNLSPGQHNPHQ